LNILIDVIDYTKDVGKEYAFSLNCYLNPIPTFGVIRDLNSSTEIGVRVSASKSNGTGIMPFSRIIFIISGMLIAEHIISLPFGKFLA
jgi:hypothetical protein